MPPVFPFLPPRIAGLAELANNLSWSWNRDARALFRSLDEHLWTSCRYDPLKMLALVPPDRLVQCMSDQDFMTQYDAVMRWHQAERSSDVTWFARSYPALRDRTIAYFCAEFGFYHSVPIYSGGLGVLAGDHCKTASDLGVPIVGVGIFYRGGYFDQRIRQDGWQEETHVQVDPQQMPLEPVDGPDGEPYLTRVPMLGRDVYVRAWRLVAGRVGVYLLDTDLERNHPDDRALLSKLYSGGAEMRLRQEWLLGVGGVRVLRALGIKPSAWHANEGHAAFMFVERVRELVETGRSYDQAVSEVRESSTFTTHTPVAAGHDYFGTDMVAACAGPMWEQMGIDRDTFMRIGENPAGVPNTFHMTVAAIRMSRRVNAVSRSHEAVTRHMWAPLWPKRRESELPISHVTNGVHVATWMANQVIMLLDRHLGDDWGTRADDPVLWERILDLDDTDLWRVHQRLKYSLFGVLRDEAREAFARRERDATQLVGSGVLLDPAALTIGFARRFATYKRAGLIFHDVERLLKILTNSAQPVQIIFSGKAHPADDPAKQLLQEVYQTTRDARFEGRIAFVEDYDMNFAHLLVQGVDLWLNLPRVPLEASGTSGMKAALNGVPQLSTLDGWWAEGFNGQNGWAIKTPVPEDAGPEADGVAAEQLYQLLERNVVPTYYDRDLRSISARWVLAMKHAMRAAGLRFTARRMLLEYATKFYVPSILGESSPDAPPTA
ncbi:MAG TPA: alpha-glucan family phosphorylase [Gemmatimonadaceae bacterium]|nr:alpha-glucan family phosphorylase [Gemmatimonadaceae bacterium]